MPPAVFYSAEEFARWAAGRNTVLTVGNFDGAHLGHQRILGRVVQRAREAGLAALAVTFDPHPLKVLRPAEAPAMIFTPAQRMAALAGFGLDALLVLPFDRDFAALSPEAFVRDILVAQLRAAAVVVGESFRFGHQQAGDVALLRARGADLGFAVESIPPVRVRGRIVSSSAIRQAVREGNVHLAGRLLGRPYAVTGEIRSGTGQGRRLLVPTLNLTHEQELLPASGVYVTEVTLEAPGASGRYASATNVGVRPTFNGSEPTVESHLFDFSQELKTGRMEVRFWRRLRDERKFSGVAELKEQIARDLARARAFFRRLDSARRLGQPA
jgi:riboflavin kinase/FMN adenylyltransferase